MNTLKIAAFAAALVGGAALAGSAEAQPWGYGPPPGHGYGYGYGRGYAAPQPQWVHPRILRKQAQLRERFVEKYGYIPQQQHGWHGRPYGHPHHYDGYYRPRRDWW